MRELLSLVQADAACAEAMRLMQKPGRAAWVYGLTGSQKPFLLAASLAEKMQPIVVVAVDDAHLEEYRREMALWLPDLTIYEMPALPEVSFALTARSRERTAVRMEALSALARCEAALYLTTIEAVAQGVCSQQELLGRRLTLKNGAMWEREKLLAELVRCGYERVDAVDSRGQFSVRGGVIDIFPLQLPTAVRLEFFDNEIDLLRSFDPETQRSLERLEQVDILPAQEEAQGTQCLLSYAQDGAVIFDDPARLREAAQALLEEWPAALPWGKIVEASRLQAVQFWSLMLQKVAHTEAQDIISIAAKGVMPFHGQFELLTQELRAQEARQAVTVLLAGSEERLEALQQALAAQGQGVSRVANSGSVRLLLGEITAGFEWVQAKVVVFAEQDLLGRHKRKQRRAKTQGEKIRYFRDIRIGDYVVHASHGIGRYAGVEILDIGGVRKDYLLIRYTGDDKLYLPTDQVGLLQKYIGQDGEAPKLSRMGGKDWQRVRSRTQAAVADLAQELVALYAARQEEAGFAFEADTPWQREFEESFPYEETPDQLQALEEIKADMEQPRPMDRLLCGDVGFGKTEVAVRAAFKAVMSGKQVAMLVPTTVLAQQHYQTLSSRFAGFGVATGVVSRFRSAKEIRKTLEEVAAGKVDVLVGTHRMLTSDVRFKDLGLLVIDEEQRFGVAQKEKIKQWRSQVDVLSLSATPIPRTLHMSLVGVRDMSIIETPPEDRLPVETYVAEFHEEIAVEAISRELRRGGQVYVVHNRIQGIERLALHLGELFPQAGVRVAHGQMAEEQLEQVMMDFYEGEEDILVCTSIIESGLDVPNANTILVYDADRLGLSQLYQMRGRVGRSSRTAFAYFTYRKDKVLTEVAEKRLQAIKEFTELGAGFKIAMRDLEIRGAGSLLGPQQHGHIVSVGFEMYCRLLDEAVQELRTGEKPKQEVEPLLDIKVDAYLPEEYVGDAMQKMELYQRIAGIRRDEEVEELLDELLDRFGEPPQAVLRLLAVAKLKNRVRRLGIRSIVQKPEGYEVAFQEPLQFAPEHIMALKEGLPSRVAFFPGSAGGLRLKTANLPQEKAEALLFKSMQCLEEGTLA